MSIGQNVLENKPEYVHPHEGFRTFAVNNPIPRKRLHYLNLYTIFCPICGELLKESSFVVPVSRTEGVSCRYKSCGKHNFLDRYKKHVRLLKGNPYAFMITTDTDYCFKFKERATAIFEGSEYNYILLFLMRIDCLQKHHKDMYLIIGNRNRTIYDHFRVIDYKCESTRQLLTEIYRNFEKEITFDGIKYRLVSRLSSQKYGKRSIVSTVTIKKGGGYTDGIIGDDCKVVDILLYSPYTKKYEITHATYSESANINYMDISLYKDFYRKYGNPEIDIEVENNKPRSDNDFKNLREESIIHAFGYSVGSKENLSTAARQSILADVMDLELISPGALASLLESFIARFKAERFEFARLKWSMDLEFVMNYNVNPDRFYIVE